MNICSGTRVGVFLLLAGFSVRVMACPSPAAYRSVVVNVPPANIPSDATTLKVRIESVLWSSQANDIQGMRGAILSANPATESRQFEIVARLGSMCNTWIEAWSTDHDVKKGILTGYIIGYDRGVRNGYEIIEHLLFQGAVYRSPLENARGLTAEGAGRRIDPSANWRPFKVDPDAMARSLSGDDNTNGAVSEAPHKP